ncbi:hypothetical protein VOLCADRAFT_88555 [Volvox carteri f. nagariensis]|uniref:Uncharacterized protein n=1 Tax=Volvox carteri f. nagariensis TaxID=3068 RepID=D8TPB4_VOLCA|nr:uncharacterized protein VOLCADRAFT_88555 [Volvox carteri f. nagariensis]EFJ50731.1 hypothetical protein VOLCADRAFT_88555 [Volvox carteri f. nagariensis]|eukprot:XP_002948324.1 hypothetical protein VOLCADRAFT_88555 [Volvox carteri f. nagariensis]
MDIRSGHYATTRRGPDGALVDKPKDELQAAKERIIKQQAAEGKMPGAMLMQDRAGDNKQEAWGNVSADMYDEGASQMSYATPGLDAGVGGSGESEDRQPVTRGAESGVRRPGALLVEDGYQFGVLDHIGCCS